MIHGLYLSAQGAEAQSTRLGVIANNLANASTNAFKRDIPVFQAFPPFDVLNGTEGQVPPDALPQTGGMALSSTVTDFSNGSLRQTKSDLDVALVGPGFFQVTDGRQKFLTRDGQFSLNEQGELVTASQGMRVVGDGGQPILVPPEAKPQISTDGTVWGRFIDGSMSELGRIDVVRPESPAALTKLGNNLYAATGRVNPAVDGFELKAGYIESSGTNPILETLEMIQATRQFETNLTMLQMQDDGLGRLLQAVPLRN